MKVCITSQGPTLESPTEERFGRAPFFIIIETENGSHEAVTNPFTAGAGGVGPKAAQILIANNVKALVSGQVGGNAREVLVSAGISMYACKAGGSVKEAFDQFMNNALLRT